MKKILFGVITMMFLLTGTAFAVSPGDIMEKGQFTEPTTNTTLLYRLYVPESYDPKIQYPVLLYLHGAGERGQEGTSTAYNNVGANIISRIINEDKWKDNCIIIAPQCPTTTKWVSVSSWTQTVYDCDAMGKNGAMLAVEALLEKVISEYSVAEDRIYVSGYSMGGFGTWNLIMNNPDKFAAAIPVCGGADPTKAELIKDVPIWTFHNPDDNVVPYNGTLAMVAALKEAGSSVIYTEYDMTGHGAWYPAYQEPELLNWMFSQNLNGIDVQYDGNGIQVSSLKDITGTVIVTAYDENGRLNGLRKFDSMTLNKDEKQLLDCWDLESTNAKMIKVMVWGDMREIVPLRTSTYSRYNRFDVNENGVVTVTSKSVDGAEMPASIIVHDSKDNIVYASQTVSDDSSEYCFKFIIPDYNPDETYTASFGCKTTAAKTYKFN